MKWPPQDTGVFAPASCVVCCTPTPPTAGFMYSILAANAEENLALCGFEQFGWDGTARLRVFGTRTWSGSIGLDWYNMTDTPCDTFGESDTFAIGGSATSTPNDIGGCDITTDSLNQNGSLSGWDAATPGPPGEADNYTNSQTADTVTQTGTGSCIDQIVGTYPQLIATGSITDALSDEDFPADAVARLRTGGTWSDYSAGEYTAGYEAQHDFATFHYRAVRWQYSASGKVPGHSYQIAVNVLRVAYSDDAFFQTGAPAWALYGVHTETVVADGSGVITASGIEVPNDEGYATEIDESSLVVTAL